MIWFTGQIDNFLGALIWLLINNFTKFVSSKNICGSILKAGSIF